MKKINSFRGEYAFLSNFFYCPFILGGELYMTAEHYYQSCKATNEEDRLKIVRVTSPGEAKFLGRRIKIRKDWDNIKLDVMKKALNMKFHDPGLVYLLLNTGDAYLEEGNTYGDTFWGVCKGVGENHLGQLLMELRKTLS